MNDPISMTDVPVLTVSELTRQVKDLIEANFPYVWVRGEVSNCKRARSGHVYLTLKDEGAQLQAVIWRSTASRMKFEIDDGLEVTATGPLEVYQPHGSYKLIVEELIPQGIGALELAFRQLREKLAAEGLFDPDRKRPLPRFPRRIALATSPTGAAVRDMLQVITRRWPAADIVLLPVAVQGDGAAEQIAAALQMAPRIPGVDVVIAGRGGGSLEDLWAFNEEVVARAIFQSPLPVVSAVGHEIDVSIADLVADRRALTPSEAGEIVVPDRKDVLNELQRLRERLTSGLRDRAARARIQLDALASRRLFTRPLERIHDLSTRLDDLDERLKQMIRRRLDRSRQQVDSLAGSLNALSPLNVLSRGYSITQRQPTGEVVRSADQLAPGEEILTLLEHGRVSSRVETTDPESTPARRASEGDNNGQTQEEQRTTRASRSRPDV